MTVFLKKVLKKIKWWQLLVLFFIINLFFLENFPFIHSDEAWLSGLSRQIMETKNLASTESFFDLMPRYPHAIKVFFHLLQIIFIKIIGYRIFTFRLISLISAILAAYFFYQSSYLITKSKALASASLLILLVDLQFIYSSHLARQEAVLLLIYLAAFYYFSKNNSSKKKLQKTRNDFNLALILGSAIGFHPNAFLISLPFILIYSYQFFSRKIKLKNYFTFGITLALVAVLFVYFSFQLDPDFINHYKSYGSNLGVLNPLIIKIKNLKLFYLKLFYQVSGSYYLPQIKFQLIFFGLITFTAAVKSFFQKDKVNCYLLFNLIALNLGYLLIGRYNQTSIVFIFPITYLLFINLIKNINFKIKYILISLLIIILSLNTITSLIKDSHFNYNDYLKEIEAVVKKDERVLANLNTDYYFNNNSLYDYRNLAYLKANNINFADYIQKNKIKYIIYPEEMDFIYNTRPKWNILYGNLYPYYSEMKQFIKKNTSLIKVFKNSSYGIRITEQIGRKNWEIKIYKINKDLFNN